MSLSSTQSYRKTAQTHRIGLSTDKPDAADVLVGTLYFSTDTFTLERSNGTVWESYAGIGGSGGTGDVTGPASSIVDNLATYADTTGKLIKDGGTSAIALNNAIAQNSTQIGDLAAIPYTTVSATSLSNARQLIASTNIAFDTATAGQLKISSIGGTGNVVGPASSVDSSVPAYDGTTGKLIKDLGLLIFGSSELRPVNDGSASLGNNAFRFYELHATSAIISDLFNASSSTALAYGAGSGGFEIVPSSSPLYLGASGQIIWRTALSGFLPIADNTYDIGGTSTRVRAAYLGNSLSIGTNPASAGTVRLENWGYIAWRNNANTADMNAVYVGGDVLHLGEGTTNYAIIHTRLIPITDATIDLGAVSNKWRDLYLSGNVNAGGLGSTPLNASNLTSGTVADARLSTNVPLKDQANTFTANQTISGTLTVNNSGGNVALKNAANTFTFNQAIYAVSPNWRLYDTAATTDQHNVQISYAGNVFKIQTLNDAFAVQTNLLSLTRSGDATIANNLTVNGTGGNVACKDQANTFTSPDQRISGPSYARLFLEETGQPADSRLFNIILTGQSLYTQAINDAATVVQATPLQLTRTGDAKVGRDLYEKNRTTPMGHWISFTPVPSGWSISQTYSAAYSLIGKTLFVCLRADGTSTNIASLKVQIPGSFNSSSYAQGQSVAIALAGAWEVGWTATSPGANDITIYRSNLSSFPVASISIGFTITIPIQ